MKRTVVTLLQIAITVGVLYMLLHDPEKRARMGLALRHANRSWLFAAFLAYGLVETVAAWRWEKLLAVQGIILSRLRLATLVLIGLFFNFFIPGGTGGDVVKLFYLLREAPGKRAGAVLSVLVDRIIGLFAVILLAAVFMATRWRWLTAPEQVQGFVWSALIVLGISAGAIIFAFLLSSFGLIHRLPKKFPGRTKMAELALAFSQYGRAPKAAFLALVSSLLCNLGYFYVFYCAAKCYETPAAPAPTYAQFCTIMPVVNTITALPISLGGLGVREGLFQIFLNQLTGVPEAEAVVISSTGFLVTALWGLLGGALYLLYRPSEHARIREIDAAIGAVEAEVADEEVALELAKEDKK
jgi:hypothetical protein